MHARDIISTHPAVRGNVSEALVRCVDECYCAAACNVCGEECQRHAGQHEHCRICAEACRRCEQACQEAMRDVG